VEIREVDRVPFQEFFWGLGLADNETVPSPIQDSYEREFCRHGEMPAEFFAANCSCTPGRSCRVKASSDV